MSNHPSRAACRRAPQPRHPRLVDTLERAIAALKLTLESPPRPEIIAMMIDEDYIGHSMIVVDGTSPGSESKVIEVVCLAAERADARDRVVLASVRPDGGVEPDDIERWAVLDGVAAQHGCELIEWLVLDGRRGYMPRALTGAPERWP